MLKLNGYGGRKAKVNEKNQCFKGWETLVITFKASSTGGGGTSRTISSKVQYPHDQDCFTTNGGQVTMAYSGMSAPKMDHIETTYIDGGGTPIVPHQINLDGTTPTETRLIFQNTGGSDATGIKLEVEPYGQYTYFDIEQIYEQVEGGPKNRVDSISFTK